MRKLAIVLLFLLLAAAAFANPLCGRWIAWVNGVPDKVALVVIEEKTPMDERVVIIEGTCWLYFIRDANHAALLGWVKAEDGSVVPMLVILARVQPGEQEG